ncbi:hypothetical protein MNEG_16233, partial [Monoraphidium neglectum]
HGEEEGWAGGANVGPNGGAGFGFGSGGGGGARGAALAALQRSRSQRVAGQGGAA